MVTIVTANVGGIDDVVRPVEQSVSYDYHCYTEDNLPYPLFHLDNRLKGKYCKINTHTFLDHEIFIWVDGRIKIHSPHFVKEMIERLEGHEMVISLHPYRHNPYEEIEWIQQKMKEGNSYLLERYANEPFNEELKFYRKEGLPETTPLYQCGVFARRNNPRVNAIFRDWWLECLQFSNFDQSQFSHVAWKNYLSINAMTPDELNQFVTIGKHKT